MDGKLELREHGLAEEGAAKQLQQLIEVEDPLGLGPGRGHHQVAEELLVAGRGDLAGEYGVARRRIGLGAVGQHRVHGVAPLVSERGQAFVVFREV